MRVTGRKEERGRKRPGGADYITLADAGFRVEGGSRENEREERCILKVDKIR